jgi:uncharacterized protein with HEPN domain
VPPRDWRLRIEDIITAIQRVLRYVEDIDAQDFSRDEKTIDAVCHNFVVIGEAAGRIPAEIVAAASDLPWSDMCDMRNVVVHEYFGVDPGILWQTVREDLPPLLTRLKELLEEPPRATDPTSPAPPARR